MSNPLHLPTILKLKRTLSAATQQPLSYREIGARMGMTGANVSHHVLKNKLTTGACPLCLRRLEREKTV
jgi:DNA-binding CsgD family transcriptional regulator